MFHSLALSRTDEVGNRCVGGRVVNFACLSFFEGAFVLDSIGFVWKRVPFQKRTPR